jgi:20S proteasome alpha/beta subunit
VVYYEEQPSRYKQAHDRADVKLEIEHKPLKTTVSATCGDGASLYSRNRISQGRLVQTQKTR